MHRRKTKRYRTVHRDKYLEGAHARNAVRRARTRDASGEDTPAIRRAFAALSRKARLLGLVVDHIVPLAPCRMCGTQGAHEERNWQLLTPSRNSSKGNRCQRSWLS